MDVRDAARQRRVVTAPSEIEAALEDPGNTPLARLMAYWRAHRGALGAIPRDALRPHHIQRLLPHMFLADRIDGPPFDIRYRLVGTAAAALNGDVTGLRLSEIAPRDDEHEALWRSYAAALDGAPCIRLERHARGHQAPVRSTVLLLPMTRSGDTIDSVMAIGVLANARPAPSPAEPPRRRVQPRSSHRHGPAGATPQRMARTFRA
jgi:hypothetical protein